MINFGKLTEKKRGRGLKKTSSMLVLSNCRVFKIRMFAKETH